MDIAVKSTEAKPGAQLVEREFGMFEIHSHSQSEVLEAGRIVLDRLSLKPEEHQAVHRALRADHHQR
ncbi:MAG: hypothetical protein U0V48_18695 [Anaerolineales bacterium]